jgi:hypothetical protein
MAVRSERSASSSGIAGSTHALAATIPVLDRVEALVEAGELISC